MHRSINGHRETDTFSMYRNMNILTLKALYYHRITLNNYFDNSFKTPRQYNTNTRPQNHTRFVQPFVRTEHGKKQRSFLVPHVLNHLPDYIFNCETYNELKLNLKTYLLTHNFHIDH